jgi:hypothetical protein
LRSERAYGQTLTTLPGVAARPRTLKVWVF